MLVTRTSVISRKAHTMDLPVTLQELARHAAGELAQNVWPNLTADQREFLISGVTPDEWAATFGGDR